MFDDLYYLPAKNECVCSYSKQPEDRRLNSSPMNPVIRIDALPKVQER